MVESHQIRKRNNDQISNLLKKCAALVLFCVVLAGGILPVSAQQTGTKDGKQESAAVVADDAALLMEEEADWLREQAQSLSDDSGWNVIVATCKEADGRSAQQVCEDNFNQYTAGDDGISCLIDMDNREIYLATAGEAQWYLTDGRIGQILDESYEAVTKEDYAQCLFLMIKRSGEAYQKGIPDNAVIYNQDTGERIRRRSLTGGECLAAVLAALACGAGVFCAIVGKYRLKWGTYAYDFHESGEIHLTKEEDRFVNQVVTHRHIPRENGTGGGGSHSTVHTGSGGRSFGGGGRKF